LIESGQKYFSFEVFSNASLLVNKIIKKMDNDLFAEKKKILHKTLLNGLDNFSLLLVDNHLRRASSLSSMDDHLTRFYEELIEEKEKNEFTSNETIFKNLWIEAYLGYALKCNEKELRDSFIEVKRWSIQEISNSNNSKNKLHSKLVLVQKQKIMVEILNAIISKISFMGISLYEEVLQVYVDFQDRVIELSKLTHENDRNVYENLFKTLTPNNQQSKEENQELDEEILDHDLSDIEELSERKDKPVLGKRSDNHLKQESSESINWKVYIIKNFEYESLILKSLKLLFENDEGSFMDAFKFESISGQLMKLVANFRISEESQMNLFFFQNCAFPVISSLLKLVSGKTFFSKIFSNS
jgi:hypothetical protein